MKEHAQHAGKRELVAGPAHLSVESGGHGPFICRSLLPWTVLVTQRVGPSPTPGAQLGLSVQCHLQGGCLMWMAGQWPGAACFIKSPLSVETELKPGTQPCWLLKLG